MDASNLSAEIRPNAAQTMGVQPNLLLDNWLDGTVSSGNTFGDSMSLFEQFISTVAEDSANGLQSQPEFPSLVRDLCTKAPSIAFKLAKEIFDCLGDDSGTEFRGLDNGLWVGSMRRPERKGGDPNYHIPKSSGLRAKTNRTRADTSHKEEITCRLIHDESSNNSRAETLVTESSLFGLDDSRTEDSTDFQNEVQSQPHHSSRSVSLPKQKGAPCGGNDTDLDPINREPLVVPKEPTGKSDDSVSTHHPEEVENQEIILPDSKKPTSSDRPALTASFHEEPITPPSSSFALGRKSRPETPLSNNETTTSNTTLEKGSLVSPLTQYDQTASLSGRDGTVCPETTLSIPPEATHQQLNLGSNDATQVQNSGTKQLILAQENQIIAPLATLIESPSFDDMVANSVQIIYEMSKHQEVVTDAHSGILRVLQSKLKNTVALTLGTEGQSLITPGPTTWSASTWINMLEAGHTRSKKSSIFSIIEWIGASEWFDTEVAEAEKAPPPTKGGKPRTRLAIIVMDKYVKEAYNTAEMETPGTVTLKNREDFPSFMGSTEVTKKIFDTKKRWLNKNLNRGRRMRQLVQKTHLGIIFDKNIWGYIKSGKEKIEKLAESFQADPRKIKLLSILDEQVELLAKEGRPNLRSLFDSFETSSLMPSEEVSNLRAEYGFEEEPVSQLCFEAAINRVVEEISRVLDKTIVGDQDCIMVNGTVELSCGMFNRLRSRAWLKNWDIAAALEMADRSPSVRHYLSIPFHKGDINGNIVPISNPLKGWRKKIDDWRAEVENDIERQQVYICPLNINADHFTLLEINEKTRMICHYDSMASPGVRQRKKKTSLVGRTIEAEFRHLGFKYTEAPTPQQGDGWSCGLMVIRNAKRRMNGLAVGGWHDIVNPDRVIKGIMDDCQVFLANGVLQPSPLSKKRKRIAENLQDDIWHASRSSKRLRNIAKDS